MRKKLSQRGTKSGKTPYSSASDDEKVKRNWNKAKGLFERGEYSVAVLRCATCVELAVNFAIRQELVVDRDLPLPFVDKLLRNANGLTNKYQNIYLPIMEANPKHDQLKRLWRDHVEKINRERNAVAHSGEFRTRRVARDVIDHSRHVLIEIMSLYGRPVELKDM